MHSGETRFQYVPKPVIPGSLGYRDRSSIENAGRAMSLRSERRGSILRLEQLLLRLRANNRIDNSLFVPLCLCLCLCVSVYVCVCVCVWLTVRR